MLFIKLPIEYGWLFTIVTIVLISYIALLAIRSKDYSLAIVLTAIAAHCLIDDLAIQLQFNSFLFLAGVACLRSGKNKPLDSNSVDNNALKGPQFGKGVEVDAKLK